MKKIIFLILIFSLLCSCANVPEEKPVDNVPPETSEESIPEEEPEPIKLEVPESYYAFRKGAVKYSSIDPESDLAKSAVDFVRAYLMKQYSENEEIESFEITDIEIDMPNTNWYVNTWQYNGNIKHYDMLNNFLVIRHRSNIKMKEGLDYYNSFPDQDLDEPIEGHRWVVYDPENKYDFTSIDGYDWKDFNGNPWPWNDYSKTEEEIFDALYARKEDEMPLHTFIEPDDEFALLAAEQVRTELEECLKTDPNVISYEILDVEADINQTNWYINMPSVQDSDFTVGDLRSFVICVRRRWKMDVVSNPSINPDSIVKFFYNDDNEIIESAVFRYYDCGEWLPNGYAKYPYNHFDDLTDEKLIGMINEIP